MILLKFKVDLSVNPKKVENEYGLPDINAVMNNDNLCYNQYKFDTKEEKEA